MRVCEVARHLGMDISGSFFRLGGEPFTAGKQDLFASLGIEARCSWAMAEAGTLAGGCRNRQSTDEVHLYTSKVAAIARPKEVVAQSGLANVLYLSSVCPVTPRLLLNVDTGDSGVLGQRDCGCLLEEVGLSTHLHTIRSYEKLTAGGMHFLGLDFLRLVEEVLPAAHGGGSTDYQFVEETGAVPTRVILRIAERVGPIDQRDVRTTVLDFLASHSRGDAMMVQQWATGGVLQVVRQEPEMTQGGKIPAFRVIHEREG